MYTIWGLYFISTINIIRLGMLDPTVLLTLSSTSEITNNGGWFGFNKPTSDLHCAHPSQAWDYSIL